MSTAGVGQQLGSSPRRARRTNRICVIETLSESGTTYESRIDQWSADEAEACVDDWSRAVAISFLTGAQQTGFDLVWHYWHRGETADDIAGALFPDGADAAIILTPTDRHEPLMMRLSEMGLPFVLAYARLPESPVPWVACDNKDGSVQAVRHLVKLGHQRLGFIGGPLSSPDLQERVQGYSESVKDAGLTFDDSLVVDCPLGEDPERVKPIALQLLRRPDRPTALVCGSDGIAVAVMEAAWESGLSVPDDLAVTGFDDSECATQVLPNLTTVRQPVKEIATTAFYLAACAAVGQEMPATGTWQVDLPVSLIVRDSCGAAASSHEDSDEAQGADAREQAARYRTERHMRQLTAVNQEMRRLLSVISHDLRSPLVTIQGFAASLERKHSHVLDEKGRSYLTRIRASSENLAQLLEELLAVSRSHNRPLNLSRVSMVELVESVLSDLAEAISRTKARITVASDMPAVMADALRLRQVLANLVGNAVKHVGDQPRPEIWIGHNLRSREHEFFVRDNGPGIPAEHREAVFELFWRSPNAETKGAGVGLSVVKAVVLRHGGRVWVESEKGAGATFRFTLPRKEIGYGHGNVNADIGAPGDTHHRG